MTGRPQAEGQATQKFRSNYLDVSNKPLFPFGYGLSYTSFSYGNISVSKTNAKGNEKITALCIITNNGKYDGEEVVQLYIRDVVGSITRPVKELRGFQKISLKSGESKTISFSISPENLKFYNYNLKYDWEPGEFQIMIGGNSDDVKMAKINWVK